MFRFLGRLMRLSVLAVVAGGALVAIVGVHRVKAAYVSVRDHVRSNVDGLVDARIALRHEVEGLSRDYPKRIAELRSQLGEIDRDLLACERERLLSGEVVTLCRADVDVLRAGMDALSAGAGTFAFRGDRLTLAEAERRAGRIAETARTHEQRRSDLDRETELLSDERDRLRGELAVLEEEFRSFTAQANSLLREIDALSRQEKLVSHAERPLEEVKARIDRRRTEMEVRLQALTSATRGGEYEARARLNLAGE
ncbi:MAG: hypothetical protein MUE73_18545 [Planctomycetes bacterium]|nr:hypothetical protein [Planctomycetota bacterium]